MKRLILFGACVLSACGGSSPTKPTPPTLPPQQVNRAPVIASASVSPSFGIADLHTFSVTASATDADNDALTYTWEIAGSTATGATRTFSMPSPGGSYTVKLTVADGKGGTVSQDLSLVVASLTGTWSGTLDRFPFQMTLTQGGSGAATGTWVIPGAFSGGLDPAVANRVELSGRVVLRCKVTQGSFSDFTLEGTLQADGRTFTGNVSGSGFSGQGFQLTR